MTKRLAAFTVVLLIVGTACAPRTVGRLSGPFDKGEYPTAKIDRPLVLPNHMGQVGLGLGYWCTAGYGSYAYGGERYEEVELFPEFQFGIADVVEVGVHSGLLFAPDVDWTQEVELSAHYLAYDSDRIDFAPGLSLPLGFYEGAPFRANLDALTRVRIDDRWFLRFGEGAVPIWFSPNVALGVVASGGVGYQLSDEAVVFGGTRLFDVRFGSDVSARTVWDEVEFRAGAQYTPIPELDVSLKGSVSCAWDRENSFAVGATAMARWRF